MSQVDLLYRLQQVDDDIAQKKQRLGEVLRLQKGSGALAAARQRAETAAATLQKMRTQQQDLNLELKGLNDKTKRSEKRLYSGLVKNPKELSDLQNEIDSLNRRRAGLEDEVLEAMIMVEEAQEENDAVAATLEQLETEWAASQKHLQAEQSDLVQQINELMRNRKEQAQSIPTRFMAAYDHVMKRGMGSAVARLTNNRCRGCQVTVPANLVKAADEGKLVYCDNCGRILAPA
ncbi:MAG: C4-type zinc ribbon domain-containing protein [Candidatus Promineifilaceae bacterium]